MDFYSKSFIYTLREDPKVADCRSQKLLLKGSYIFMVSSGIYSYLPLGYKVLDNITRIVAKHMDAHGAQRLMMSALQPIEIWQKTGRDKDMADVMFRFKDRKERDLCLGPTHEEMITEIVRRNITSYKQLPCILYQIQTKFRDEIRPRFGLMRTSEFIMKDAYSFDADMQGLQKNYDSMVQAYKDIFAELGLNIVITEADSGVMGGKVSHEFMVLADIGEDLLYLCADCKKYFRAVGECPDCKKPLAEKRMIEIGHTFQLGTKYSQVQEALFLDSKGGRQPMIMGCYGIGVSRLLPAIIEQCSDEKGIAWPKGVSPYDVTLAVLDNGLLDEACALAQVLEKSGLSVLIDDRDAGPGAKFNDAYLLGNPYLAIMGKKFVASRQIEVEVRKTKEKLSFSKEELANYLKTEFGL